MSGMAPARIHPGDLDSIDYACLNGRTLLTRKPPTKADWQRWCRKLVQHVRWCELQIAAYSAVDDEHDALVEGQWQEIQRLKALVSGGGAAMKTLMVVAITGAGAGAALTLPAIVPAGWLVWAIVPLVLITYLLSVVALRAGEADACES